MENSGSCCNLRLPQATHFSLFEELVMAACGQMIEPHVSVSGCSPPQHCWAERQRGPQGERR